MSEKHVQHLLDRGGTERVPMSTSNDIVYFNSNAYHGDQLLTQEGLDTGYTNHGVTRDISVFEKVTISEKPSAFKSPTNGVRDGLRPCGHPPQPTQNSCG